MMGRHDGAKMMHIMNLEAKRKRKGTDSYHLKTSH
jgi:hypothetical protein